MKKIPFVTSVLMSLAHAMQFNAIRRGAGVVEKRSRIPGPRRPAGSKLLRMAAAKSLTLRGRKPNDS